MVNTKEQKHGEPFDKPMYDLGHNETLSTALKPPSHIICALDNVNAPSNLPLNYTSPSKGRCPFSTTHGWLRFPICKMD
jgi:hypothetical protein